ncbi:MULTISPECIES: hypothetical protein [Streptomyces]|uniref:Cobyrinic acid a,c-diamide synthase n=1 Tax=Streptomyces alfalfae TaxID=1642299 RepID=A0A7T4TWT3_9ACTN|nr:MULTISPECIES: hypothetical protein [Streptomyces]QQC88549.1 hypothetical protein I8755_09105 [Streptomyces alfalfae]QUI31007.1 hypothetical protein H9W91_09175 [Streptomyces alfalfae]
MSRRVSLPGADELFRTTGGMALQSSSPRRPANGEARVPAPAGESDETAAADEAAQGEGGEPAEHAATDAESGAESRSRAASADADKGAGRRSAGQAQEGAAPQGGGKNGSSTAQARRRARAANRRPSGRERHDEKITVYVSAEELMDLEHARLVLRGEHGLAVDRGRIVREAVAVVLADLESRGDASILVRRLRGR